MRPKSIFLVFLVPALIAAGCSDSGDDAPVSDRVHPEGWVITHGAEALGDSRECVSCHGGDLKGDGDAVSCFLCHVAGSPFDLPQCVSCHNLPPDGDLPAGSVRPNRAGGHPAHDGLPLFPGRDDCSACHEGAGTGTALHFDFSEPADVAMLAGYDAKNAAATFDPVSGTCSGVSCHGGKATPRWTASLDATASCAACHERGREPGSPQANSYFSGRHILHVELLGIPCQTCHDPEVLGRAQTPNHFNGLATPEFEQDPAETIRTVLGYDEAAQNCTTNLAGCHGGEVKPW